MKKNLLWLSIGLVGGIALILAGKGVMDYTSQDKYCISCHIHTDADRDWKRSNHYETSSGTRTSCVECHLPPHGSGSHYIEKARMGAKDIWSYWTKDSASFDWNSRSRLEVARTIVPEASCIECHENNFPLTLSKDGEDAHLYYKMKKEAGEEDLHCINCHLNVGHYMEGYTHGSNTTFGKSSSAPKEVFTQPGVIDGFNNFVEYIPNTAVSFNMIAIPGGVFKMGSPEDEAYREADEGPVRAVELSPFFMAEVETTWDEYMAFYSHTSVEGRSTDTEGTRTDGDVDAITGATPPYGQPDQGWGMGRRPVISITFHAAETYCRWLSKVTGKKYRLPTEAEWEYACRGGSETPYFFEGDPKKFYKQGFFNKFSKNDTTFIISHAIYAENSHSMTHLPSDVKPNPFGLRNMIGNVAEFCSDWYAPDAYSLTSEQVSNPTGPTEGKEHVVRGGSYFDNATNLRSAARSFTRTAAWLRTDPQVPKSIWWYSDCFSVGFRVVCEYEQ